MNIHAISEYQPPLLFLSGHELPQFDGGLTLSRKRLSWDICAMMKEMGYEPKMPGILPTSSSPSVSSLSSESAWHVLASGSDILTFRAAEQADGEAETRGILVLFLASAECFVNLLMQNRIDAGKGSPALGSNLCQEDRFITPLIGEHEARLEALRRQNSGEAVTVAAVPIDLWRKAGGGKAGMTARKIILQSCLAG